MFGHNPKRPAEQHDGATLDVQSIFRTFQGEGPFVGHPSIFIRLGGCNLACTFCDTEFESFQSWTMEAILHETNALSGRSLSAEKKWTHRLVIITGGEPFRQPIERLCQTLLEEGYTVQIETNGTLYRPIAKDVKIVCSPKATAKGYTRIRPDILERTQALKFIISASCSSYQNIVDIGQDAYDIPVYLQPMDEYDEQKNTQNSKRCIELADAYGYRISLQTHKLLGIE